MKITRTNAQIRIFPVGYSDPPMEGDSGGLSFEYRIMWTMMLIGSINTPARQEYLLGIKRSCLLTVPFFEDVEYLPNEPQHVNRIISDMIGKQTEGNARILNNAYEGSSKYPGLVHNLTRTTKGYLCKDILRIALLLPIDELKQLSFPNNMGLATYLTENDLERTARYLLAKNKRESVPRMVKIGKMKFKIKKFTLPSFTTSPGKIVIDLNGGTEDLSFATDTMKYYRKNSTIVRAAAWRKTMSRRIG